MSNMTELTVNFNNDLLRSAKEVAADLGIDLDLLVAAAVTWFIESDPKSSDPSGPNAAESLRSVIDPVCENCGNPDPMEIRGGLYCAPCDDLMSQT